jgi:hypothetical protein
MPEHAPEVTIDMTFQRALVVVVAILRIGLDEACLRKLVVDYWLKKGALHLGLIDYL